MSDTNQALFTDKQDDGFNIRDFIFTYILRFWYLYILFISGALLYAWLKVRYTTPIYQVNATILIRNESSKGSGVSEESIIEDLGLMQGGLEIQNEIEIIKSRSIMESVIRNKGLDVEYYNQGRVLSSENYPGVFLKATFHEPDPDKGFNVHFSILVKDEQNFTLKIGQRSADYQFGQMIQIPEGKYIFTLMHKGTPNSEEFIVIFRKPEGMAQSYANGLSANTIDSRSSILRLSYKHPVPQKAIDILNGVVEAYNQVTIEDKNRVGKNTVQFIDDRLKYLTTELYEVEGSLERYKKGNDIPTEISASVDVLVSQMSEYDKEQGNLELQKIMLDGLKSYLENQLTQNEPAPINLLPTNNALATLVGRYNDLLLERNRQLKTATGLNPVVQNLQVQIDLMRSSILETIKNTSSDFDLSLTQIRNKNDLFRRKIGSIPTKERGLIEIKRQQSIKEALFLYLLQKREETALSLAVAVPNSRMIDMPIRAGGPISPNKRSIYVMALFIGLLIPSLIIYLKYLLTNTVQTESDITSNTNTPFLAAIGYQKGNEQLVVKANSRSAISEMFRLLRTNLEFLAAGKKNQIILITSTVSGEGKSFVTLNLGVTLALADKKTIVLELDLRKPKLVKYLTQKPAPTGLSNYLIGQLDYENLIQHSTVHPNLYYIGSGPTPPNPAELLLTDNIGILLERLKQDFDYILLDTPPVGMVADSFLLGKHADSSLYVVRQGHSYKGSIGYINELKTDAKLPNMAIIFNGVKAATGQYGYGQKYGYGYGYGKSYSYGYYEDSKSRPWWKFWVKK